MFPLLTCISIAQCNEMDAAIRWFAWQVPQTRASRQAKTRGVVMKSILSIGAREKHSLTNHQIHILHRRPRRAFAEIVVDGD
jgi:hypothetical protein